MLNFFLDRYKFYLDIFQYKIFKFHFVYNSRFKRRFKICTKYFTKSLYKIPNTLRGFKYNKGLGKITRIPFTAYNRRLVSRTLMRQSTKLMDMNIKVQYIFLVLKISGNTFANCMLILKK